MPLLPLLLPKSAMLPLLPVAIKGLMDQRYAKMAPFGDADFAP
jgi:hypothetical protein